MDGEGLTPEQAKLELFLCLEGGLRETRHFQKELHKEGLIFGDTTSMLEYGCIYEPAEWDGKHGSGSTRSKVTSPMANGW
jgi:hypothetical protein